MRVHFSDWTLDTDGRELRHGAEPVHLSPKAFRLLEVLVEHQPAAVSKDRLFELVWPGTFVEDSNVASLIKEMRAVLHDDARQPTIISTVYGFGYKFVARVTIEEQQKQSLKSVAVLPFTNASGPEFDYVSEGIAEELLNALIRLRPLRVVPLSTSVRYRPPNLNVKTAAHEMGVDAVVTGRVAARGDELTIHLELVNTKADSLIWSGRFHGSRSELPHLQNGIESEITVHIAPLLGSQKQETTPMAVVNSEAYNLYLRGRHQWNRRDAEGFKRAIEAFGTASQMDPGFALAHAALAEAYVVLGSREIYPANDIFPLAEQAANRALAVDSRVAAAHSAIAAVQELYKWDWPAAEASHRMAVSLDPSYASAAQWFGLHFARRGVHDQARHWIAQALAHEPFSPIINTNAAFVSYLARDFAAAVRQCEAALDLAPHYEGAVIMSGVAYLQIDPRRAIEHLEEGARLSARQPYALSHLASAYAADSRPDDARRIADELRALTSTRYVSPVDIAMAELAIGNREAALSGFETAARGRSPWLVYLRSEPRLDILRHEPRFQAVIDPIEPPKWNRPESD